MKIKVFSAFSGRSKILLCGVATSLIICNSSINANVLAQPERVVESIENYGTYRDIVTGTASLLKITEKKLDLVKNLTSKGFRSDYVKPLEGVFKKVSKSDFSKIIKKADGIISTAGDVVTYGNIVIEVTEAFKTREPVEIVDAFASAVPLVLDKLGPAGTLIGVQFDTTYENTKQIGVEITSIRRNHDKTVETATSLQSFYLNKDVLKYYLPKLDSLKYVSSSSDFQNEVDAAVIKYRSDLLSARKLLVEMLEELKKSSVNCGVLCRDQQAANKARILALSTYINGIDSTISNIDEKKSIYNFIVERVLDGVLFHLAGDMESLNDKIKESKSKIDSLSEISAVSVPVKKVVLSSEIANVPRVVSGTITCVAAPCTDTNLIVVTPTTPNLPRPPQPQPTNRDHEGMFSGLHSSIRSTFMITSAVDGLSRPIPPVGATEYRNGEQITLRVLNNLEQLATVQGITRVESDYQYTAWGEWSGSINFRNDGIAPPNVTTFNRGYFIVGRPTTEAEGRGLSGSATYNGRLVGDYAQSGGGPVQVGAVTGAMALTANFSNRTIDGRFNMFMGGTLWATPRMTSTSITTYNNFSGPLVDGGGGNITGRFYGPQANEVGGSFYFFRQPGPGVIGGGATGIFLARPGGPGVQ